MDSVSGWLFLGESSVGSVKGLHSHLPTGREGTRPGCVLIRTQVDEVLFCFLQGRGLPDSTLEEQAEPLRELSWHRSRLIQTREAFQGPTLGNKKPPPR